MGGLGYIYGLEEIHFTSLSAGTIDTCCVSTAARAKEQAPETHCVFFLIDLDFIIAIKIWPQTW